MACCVPLCKSTPENVSTSDGISYHGLPTDRHLRVAWLRALGMLDSRLPDCAVVCSLHFLNEDIYRTESGSVQVGADAIPAAVQFCMICLATDSKLLSMKKHKLLRTYINLTGYTMCEAENLRQTLCVECAHRLNNFSKFRDKSLRACALMRDLINEDKVVSIHDMNMINRTNSHFKSNIVKMVLEPDHFDLYLCEYNDINEQPPAAIEDHTNEQLTSDLHENMKTSCEIVAIKEEPYNWVGHDENSTEPHQDVKQENVYNTGYGDVDYVPSYALQDDTIKLETRLMDDVAQILLYQKEHVGEQSAETSFKSEDDALECHDVADVDTGLLTRAGENKSFSPHIKNHRTKNKKRKNETLSDIRNNIVISCIEKEHNLKIMHMAEAHNWAKENHEWAREEHEIKIKKIKLEIKLLEKKIDLTK